MMKSYYVAMPYQAIPWRQWKFLSNRIRAYIGIEAVFFDSLTKAQIIDAIIENVPVFHYEFYHKKPRDWYKIPRKLARDTFDRLVKMGHVRRDECGYYLTGRGEDHLEKVLRCCCP
jgi:hypothetical protein